MTARRLNAEEQRLWGAVMATVRPLRATSAVTGSPKLKVDTPVPPVRGELVEARLVARPPTAQWQPRNDRSKGLSNPVANTLDASWDKRLSRGVVAPDASIDLHGHTLGSAHALLDAGLARSIGRGDRVLLLVTGKPPRPDSERPHARGAIRAAVADWLGGSRHADAIAAVRGAHPRHGGAGALYIVLRRARTPA